MSKQSDADRIRAMAQTLRSTREGNPQLLLDIRFYPGDGHVWLAAVDADGHAGGGVTQDDLASAIARIAEAVWRAGRVGLKA